MEYVQPNSSFQSPPIKKGGLILPLNGSLFVVISLIIGLVTGFFAGQAMKGNTLKSMSNTVFTAKPTYLAPVEGTLVAKGQNKITLENKGAKLDIEAPMTAPVLIQDGTNSAQAITRTLADVEIGSTLKGTVVLNEGYVSGNQSGKVTGSAFFVTNK